MNESLGTTVEAQAEQEKIKIVLHLFRHNEKESDKTKSDTEIRLTEGGRRHSKSLSSTGGNISQAMAFGSPRKRTQETAGLVMAGSQDEVVGTETLEELKEKLDKDLGYGTKLHYDDNLDFVLPESGKYLEEGLKAFKDGKLLKWLVEESDAKFKEYNVEEGYFSYSNQAKQIARIISKYLQTLPRWKALAEDDSKDYSPVLERFLGTHQTVSESFLAKAIELTKGVIERDKFVTVLGGAGFGYAEGYTVDIEYSNDVPIVHIVYKKGDYVFNERVGVDVIEKILE